MRYRLTCLTPLLIGDGSRLSPIDYMVWRDQVNVLDQNRIFRLLAKGPRLDNYLKQIKRADKLEFASWGGFAQNFADRRIPFEDPAYTRYWEALGSEHLHIPTFLRGHAGPYVPGSALKGAIRTGFVLARTRRSTLAEMTERFSKEGLPAQPGQMLENRAVGAPPQSRLKGISISDSDPAPASSMKIFLLRTATLEPKPGGRLGLRWKQAPRGSVEGDRPEESTPVFAEMAAPGTEFAGRWHQKSFYSEPDVARALHWKEPVTIETLMKTANASAEVLLKAHLQYATWTGLAGLAENLRELESRLSAIRERGDACLLSLGWGGGFLSKSGCPGSETDACRELLRASAVYARAIRTGLPFPKTRRIVFLEDKPAVVPGWALLEAG